MVVRRDPDQTRQKLLCAAFEEIHRNGFRAASVDSILASTGVTKGALYHHFSSKTELGYAVVEELIAHHIAERWIQPLEEAENPIDALIELLRSVGKEWAPVACHIGCPLNNLAQEMSPVDEGFRKRILAVYESWRGGIAEALRRGQGKGLVRPDIDRQQVAYFLIAGFEGAAGMAKATQDPAVLDGCLANARRYLETLRVPSTP